MNRMKAFGVFWISKFNKQPKEDIWLMRERAMNAFGLNGLRGGSICRKRIGFRAVDGNRNPQLTYKSHFSWIFRTNTCPTRNLDLAGGTNSGRDWLSNRLPFTHGFQMDPTLCTWRTTLCCREVLASEKCWGSSPLLLLRLPIQCQTMPNYPH